MEPAAEASFGAEFARLSELICEEWPAVDSASLEATLGKREKVIALVAERTEHTRVLVQRQLDELYREATRPLGKATFLLDDESDEVLRRVTKRARSLAEELRSQAVTEATEHVRKNPILSLLMALGFGLLLGLVMRGGGRRGRGD